MTLFIESLRRLYNEGKITKNKVDQLLSTKKITQQEYNYIIPIKITRKEI